MEDGGQEEHGTRECREKQRCQVKERGREED